MPNVPAVDRFRKLIDDISRFYADARRAQVRFGWETGRRIVEEEQDGAMRARYGTGLLLQLSKTLSEKYGAGFSKSNLLKMRRFYLLNQKESVTTQLDWTDYVELLPVKDEKTRQRLERRVLKEGLNSSQIRRLVENQRKINEINEINVPGTFEGDRLKVAKAAGRGRLNKEKA